MLILYTYDKNAILVEPIKTRSDMLLTNDVLYDTLENTGQAPKLNIMYNEASTALNRLLQKRGTVVQLSPPHSQIRNASERAILTLKNHLVLGLASVDNNFPIYL